MKRHQSAVLKLTSDQQFIPSPKKRVMIKHGSVIDMSPQSNGDNEIFSIYLNTQSKHKFLKQHKAETPMARISVPMSPSKRYESRSSFSAFMVQPKTSSIHDQMRQSELFQSTTQLTNLSLSHVQMLQRKLLAKDTIFTLSLSLLERLFEQRCKDLKIRVLNDQYLRFLDKIYQQCQCGQFNLQDMSLSSSCMDLILNLIEDGELSVLNLSQNQLYDKGVLLLAERLNSVQLVSLELGNCGIGPSGFKSLFEVLCHNITIINLNVGNPQSQYRNRLGQEGCVSLSSLLQRNIYIQMLNLRGCGITPKMLETLNGGFKVCLEMKYLCLSENELVGLHGDGLHATVSLEVLEVQGNKMGDYGMSLLGGQYSHYNANALNKLNAGHNKMSVAGLQAMLDHLAHNKHLLQLVLDGNQFYGETTGFVTTYLATNITLTHLSLKACSLSYQMVEALAYGLQKTTKLLHLNLGSNMITEKAAIVLGQVFQTFITSLKTLKMKRCGLTDEGAKPLFESLVRQPNLVELDFSCNLITDTAGLLAVKSLQQNQGLIRFKLMKNMLSYHLQLEIDNLTTEHQQLAHQKLIPDLLIQVSRIADYKTQQQMMQEKHVVVQQNKSMAQFNLSQVRDNQQNSLDGAYGKSSLVYDQLQRQKVKLTSTIKSFELLDRSNHRESMTSEEALQKLKNSLRSQNNQHANLQRQSLELHNKHKTLLLFFKQQVDNLKMTQDIVTRKMRNTEAEHDAFSKQITMMAEQLKKRELALLKPPPAVITTRKNATANKSQSDEQSPSRNISSKAAPQSTTTTKLANIKVKK